MKTFFSLIFMGISAYLFFCLDEMTWVAYTLIALVAILHICVTRICYISSNLNFRGEETEKLLGLLIMPIVLTYLYYFCDKNIANNIEGIILLSYITIGIYVSIPCPFLGSILALTSIPITLTLTLLPWETFTSLFLIGLSVIVACMVLYFYSNFTDAFEELCKICEQQEREIKRLKSSSGSSSSSFLETFVKGAGRAVGRAIVNSFFQ